MRKKNNVLTESNRKRKLFSRNSSGELMPGQTPLLGSFEEEIVMIPLTIGEMNEISEMLCSGKLSQGLPLINHVMNHCLVYPEPSKVKLMKQTYKNKIYDTVLYECGYTFKKKKKKNNNTKKSTKRKIYELIKQDEETGLTATVLHMCGYTYLTIPKLTVRERELLIKGKAKLEGGGNNKGKTKFGGKR